MPHVDARAALPFILLVVAGGCGGPQRPVVPEGACAPAGEGERPWEGRGYAVPLAEDAPRRGAARPRVVVQEFSDFECPYCARAAPTLERLLEDYGACLQVRFRHLPLRRHPHARGAAIAAHEVYRQAGDEAFWRYHDILLANQDALAPEDLVGHARELAVDPEALATALESGAHDDVLERDRAASTALPVRLGTPSFFVNGELVSGAQSYARFTLAVDRALRDAVLGR